MNFVSESARNLMNEIQHRPNDDECFYNSGIAVGACQNAFQHQRVCARIDCKQSGRHTSGRAHLKLVIAAECLLVGGQMQLDATSSAAKQIQEQRERESSDAMPLAPN